MSDLYPSLYLFNGDNTDGVSSIMKFKDCVNNTLNAHKSFQSLSLLLEREDVDSICQEELSKLRSLSSNFGVKESRSIFQSLADINELKI